MQEISVFSDVYDDFSFYIKRRKKSVNNGFEGDYFMEKQEKYVIEDEKGVFCTE